MLIRIMLGLACAAVVGWVAVTRWSTLLTGHPAYPVLLGAVALAGLTLLVAARRARRTGALRTAGRVAAALALVAVLAAAVFLWASYPARDLSAAP